MSIGPSSKEKGTLGDIQGIAGKLEDVAGGSARRSRKTFRQFEQALTPALDYWTSILSGNKEEMLAAVAPEETMVGEQFDQAIGRLGELAPRGGGGGSAVDNLLTQKAQAQGNILLKARPEAAKALGSLAGLAGGQSLGAGSQGISALTGAAETQFGALGALDKWRQQENQFWEQLGGGLTQLLLGGLAGGFGAGDFSGGFTGVLEGLTGLGG